MIGLRLSISSVSFINKFVLEKLTLGLGSRAVSLYFEGLGGPGEGGGDGDGDGGCLIF
jgi:hypothetical protein